MHEFIHSHHPFFYLLTPLSILYQSIMRLRRFLYQKKWLSVADQPVPIIVVGNLTVGGTGKTTLVMWLANFLQQHGYKPGVVSRGYKAQTKQFPHLVTSSSDPIQVGDEPVMIAKNTQCPVVIDPNRVRAVQFLKLNDVNDAIDIILSDDGLQHYPLQRDLEIVVIDGMRKFGNGFCLPAGPLREPISRLQQVDFVIFNGEHFNVNEDQAFANLKSPYFFSVKPKLLRSVIDNKKTLAFGELHSQAKPIYAMAGIGNPKRFFAALKSKNLNFIEKTFPDHHIFTYPDIDLAQDAYIIMTEKDAVKCKSFADHRHWYVETSIEMDEHFGQQLLQSLEKGRV